MSSTRHLENLNSHNVYLLQNVNAYVVGDHYTAPWELPATKKYIDKGANYLQALQTVLKEQGK